MRRGRAAAAAANNADIMRTEWNTLFVSHSSRGPIDHMTRRLTDFNIEIHSESISSQYSTQFSTQSTLHFPIFTSHTTNVVRHFTFRMYLIHAKMTWCKNALMNTQYNTIQHNTTQNDTIRYTVSRVLSVHLLCLKVRRKLMASWVVWHCGYQHMIVTPPTMRVTAISEMCWTLQPIQVLFKVLLMGQSLVSLLVREIFILKTVGCIPVSVTFLCVSNSCPIGST